jgi:pimeloyl-ACP methyl ester carboxylesterase
VPTVTADGVDLYYEVHGEGPALLGIHGTPSSALLWQDAASVLGRHGRCIVYDRRGFARSTTPDPSTAVDLDDQVGDAAALLDALSATPAVVIGRSTGGQIALALAHRHPEKVRALVLLEPAVFTVDPKAAAWARRLRDRVLLAAADDPARASQAVIGEALGPEFWAALPGDLRDLFTRAGPAVLAEIRGHGLDLSEDPLDLRAEQLTALDQPTLVVAAEDSPRVFRLVVDRLVDALPHARSAVVPGGHLITPAHPVVLDFVDRVVAPGQHR